MALLVARRTNDRKVAGSRPTKVACITVLTGNRMGWTARCGRPPLLLPSCRKLEFRLSALMDSDLAWVNGKSGRQSWRYADAFQRSIGSHLPFTYVSDWRNTNGQTDWWTLSSIKAPYSFIMWDMGFITYYCVVYVLLVKWSYFNTVHRSAYWESSVEFFPPLVDWAAAEIDQHLMLGEQHWSS